MPPSRIRSRTRDAVDKGWRGVTTECIEIRNLPASGVRYRYFKILMSHSSLASPIERQSANTQLQESDNSREMNPITLHLVSQ